MGLASAPSCANERVGPAAVVINKSSEPFPSTNGKSQDPQPDLSAALSLKDRIQKLEQRLIEVQTFSHFFLYVSVCPHVVCSSDQL
jgi:hypothetical protein